MHFSSFFQGLEPWDLWFGAAAFSHPVPLWRSWFQDLGDHHGRTKLSTSQGLAPGRLCCIWHLALFRPTISERIWEKDDWWSMGFWGALDLQKPISLLDNSCIWLSSLAQLTFTLYLCAWVGRFLSNRFEDRWVAALSAHQRIVKGWCSHFLISIRIASVCPWRDWSECSTTASRKIIANLQAEEDLFKMIQAYLSMFDKGVALRQYDWWQTSLQSIWAKKFVDTPRPSRKSWAASRRHCQNEGTTRAQRGHIARVYPDYPGYCPWIALVFVSCLPAVESCSTVGFGTRR